MGESVWSWSKTAADNNDADSSINWSEGQTPGSVNNSSRSEMAAGAKMRDDQGGQLTLTGTVPTYTLTTNQGLAALADGVRIHAVSHGTNLAAATLNVDSLGAKKIRKLGNAGDEALVGFELLKNGHYIFQYDASADAASGAWIVLNPNQPPARGELWGLTLSNNGSDATNDIDIAAGAAADDTNVVRMVLAASITKRLDASWAVGTGNGGLDTGSIADGHYHVWLIMRSDTGVVDALFSTSASAPTMPANYDYKRRIGAIIRNSSAIRPFTQNGDQFLLTTEVTDRSSTTLSSSWALLTITVPAGIRVNPLLSGFTQQNAAGLVGTELADGDQASTPTAIVYAAATAFASDYTYWANPFLVTDTSSRIRFRVYAISGSPSLTSHSIRSRGWIDTRGRFA
jgi:hypothetical protein